MSSFWKDKRVLVTGIAGFIGSQVARKLHSLGADVTGIVFNHNRVDPDDFSKYNLVQGDICDQYTVQSTLSHYEIETVFHFAANSIVRTSARDPLTTYKINVMGTVNLLECIRNLGRPYPTVVAASSDKAYGDHDVLPYRETHPLLPKNTYDTSKACMDMIARSYAHNYDMPIYVARCSNVYGPGDMNFSRIIPNTIRRIHAGQRPTLYSDIEKMEREFIHIDDVVDAYLLLGEAKQSQYFGQAFNIGGTGPVKINDVVDMILSKMGSDLGTDIIERNSTFKEIQKQYIDAEEIRTKFGWCAKFSLDEGISKTVAWYSYFLDAQQGNPVVK